MDNIFWKEVPQENELKWREIFNLNKEGAFLSEECPVCHRRELKRYFMDRGEWQWCSYCKCYEHYNAAIPVWWENDIYVSGDKLTVIPNVLDLAYKEPTRVNKWNKIPFECKDEWNKIFDENKLDIHLNTECPICNKKTLMQFYKVSIPGDVKFKKIVYKGRGPRWRWCATCYHYDYDYMAYIPFEWTHEIFLTAGEFMPIPEILNEKLLNSMSL